MEARTRHGIYGGLVGGTVFGMIMGMMGMLPMIAKMVGSTSAGVGFLVHMVISAAIGASFALAFGASSNTTAHGLRNGLAFGAVWWLLGPLTLMPLFMGMGLGSQWNMPAVGQAMPSLMGHLIYGAILGLVVAKLSGRAGTVDAINVSGAHDAPAHCAPLGPRAPGRSSCS